MADEIGRPLLLHLLFALGSALALFAAVPSFTRLPGVDSGIFLYAAQAIVHGAVPYRDVWDNKPPGIYLVDALGLLIGAGSRWGVWTLEWISLWTAAMLGFRALRRAFGEGAALFAIACWLAAVARALEGGNFPEEFVLPLQFASLLFFQRISRPAIRLIDAAVIGILGALAFALKPNAIGLWLAIGVWSAGHSWSQRRWSPLFRLAIGAITGALIAWLPFVLWLYRNGALGPLWDQAFHYNFVYTERAAWYERIRCCYAQFRYMAPAGLSFLVLGGWAVAIYFLALRRTLLAATDVHLVSLAVIALPLETAFASTTPDRYYHHFLVPLSTWTVLLAFVAWIALNIRALAPGGLQFAVFRRPTAALGALAVVAWIAGARSTWNILRIPDEERQLALQYIVDNSSPGDTILTWGLTAALDFVSLRHEPSRYYHEFPLCTPGYVTMQEVGLFRSDLVQHKPLLIIDSSAETGRLPPIDVNDREQWIGGPSTQWRTQLATMMLPIFRYVNDNYRVCARLGKSWTVYERIHLPSRPCKQLRKLCAGSDSTMVRRGSERDQ